jgi:asparagine synthase (glutamine-hydrolysing)
VTVALTGDGGDETFGGYGFRYVPHAIESRVRAAISGFGGQSASGWAGAHWPRSARLPKPLRLGTFLDNIGRDADAAYYADLCFLKPDVVHKLLGLPNTRDPRESAVFDAVTAPYRRCPSPSPIQKAQYADLKVYLPNDVLVKVDRMSMQHALEVRCPLLDRRLVEFAFRIPTASKMPRLKAKHLLRRVAEPRLPAELLQLKKRGFTAPVGEWIAGPYAERFRSEVLDNRSVVASLIDMRQVRRMFIEQQQGRANHSYALWALWMLERWSHLTSNRPQLQGVAGVFP